MKRPNRRSRQDPDRGYQDQDHNPINTFYRAVKEKATRKLKARKSGEQSALSQVGVFGIIGWSIAIPVLIGIAIGNWIDTSWTTPISWTLILMLVGVVIGCLNAWYWIQKESQND